jgi:hypothetical protein
LVFIQNLASFAKVGSKLAGRVKTIYAPKPGEAEKAVQRVQADAAETLTVEGLLKEALRQLGR